MHDEERHFDEDSDMRVSSKLSEDLKAIFKPSKSIPPEVNRAIMDRAYQQLVRRHKKRQILRWSASAAAAVILFAFTLNIITEQHPTAIHPETIAVKTDVDRNGNVNVLDALQLARHIESTDRPNMKWDINGDGSVNQDDIDSVAFAAVSLNKGVL